MTEEIKKEITNAVLATKLDGFKELTDNKFHNIEDTLKRIEINSMGFTTKTELDTTKLEFNETVKSIYKSFEQHNENDKESFASLRKQTEEVDKRNDDNRKFIYIAVGGITVISFMMQLLAPAILRFLNWK